MPLKRRIALTLAPGIGGAGDILEAAALVERLGYDDVWFADTGAPDALTLAAVVAERCKRLRIGIAVVPVYTRTPAVLAATATTLGQLAPGRFVLGLGSSSHAMIENWHGVPFDKPLTRVRETAELVRDMMAGNKSAFDGQTLRSHGYRQTPVDPPVPIYLAALRPNMLKTAAQTGDGVILNLFPRHALPKLIEQVAAGAEQAGKDPADVEIVCRFQICVTDDKARARDVFRRAFTPYFATPVYNRYLEWLGFADVAATIREGWAERDREKTTMAFDDALIDDIAIIGSEAECRARLQEYAAGGIHTHIVTPLPTSADERIATVNAFAADRFSFQ